MLRHIGSVQIVYRGGVFNLENRQLNYRSWWHSRSFIHWFAPVNETSRLMGWLALTRVENYIIQRGEVINTDTINILQKKQAAMLYITHNSLSCWWAEGSMALSVSLLQTCSIGLLREEGMGETLLSVQTTANLQVLMHSLNRVYSSLCCCSLYPAPPIPLT